MRKSIGGSLFVDDRLNAHLGKSAIAPAALQQAIKDLEAYCRQPIAEIAARYWTSPKAPDDSSPAALLAFYQTSDRYLYESTYTEGYADHARMTRLVVKAVRRWRLTPVLDFGGGESGSLHGLRRHARGEFRGSRTLQAASVGAHGGAHRAED